jgi:hypothetical protein
MPNQTKAVATINASDGFVIASSDGTSDAWYMVHINMNNRSIRWQYTKPATGATMTHCAVCAAGKVDTEADYVVLGGVYNGKHEMMMIKKDGTYVHDINVAFGVGDWAFTSVAGCADGSKPEFWGLALNFDNLKEFYLVYSSHDNDGPKTQLSK